MMSLDVPDEKICGNCKHYKEIIENIGKCRVQLMLIPAGFTCPWFVANKEVADESSTN